MQLFQDHDFLTLPLKERIVYLSNLLSILIGFHRQALDILRDEKDALISVALPKIEHLLTQKIEIIAQINVLEKHRWDLVQAILPQQPFKLSHILALCQEAGWGDLHQKLQQQHDTLHLLLQHIQKIHDTTRALVEKSLENFQKLQKARISSQKNFDIYTPQGEFLKRSRHSRMLMP